MAAKKKVEEEIIESPVKTKVNMVKAPSPEIVQLIGSGNELIGEHHILRDIGSITFIDGKATVMSNIAEELRSQGWVK